MNDFRSDDSNQAFGENVNRTADAASHLPLPRGDEEQIRIEFATTDETASKRGFGLFHLQVVAFVLR